MEKRIAAGCGREMVAVGVFLLILTCLHCAWTGPLF